ncbi:MAG TPA: alpha-amylase family glycosyl hydrolase, partial [Acidothermaceae bacterium]
MACDANGETADLSKDVSPDTLAPNNRLVIYELPTAWSISRSTDEPERATATFADVNAMVDATVGGANFAELPILAPGTSYLTALGVNALELLPCADSFYKREWGYDTSHYLAPDADLGYPEGNLSPTPNRDLATLIKSCHANGLRFFIDVVMAFGKEDPYNHIDSQDFHLDDPAAAAKVNDPDAWTSFRSDGSRSFRNGFGSTLWRYANRVTTYDPVAGTAGPIAPAAQFMLTYLTRWMEDFHVDGVRIDSVENVANWDFLSAFKNLARTMWKARWTALGLPGDAESRFLVVGEELSLPFDLLRNGVLDGLWNDDFQRRARAAILGRNVDGEPTFEWTVKKAIDCRLLTAAGFTDGTQAVIYLTKHDVEGAERLFTMLGRIFPGQPDQVERRIKLGFVCLLTAVGVPMLLAGEEFADQHDLFDINGRVDQNGGKQIDPVNYSRITASGDDDDGHNAPMRR